MKRKHGHLLSKLLSKLKSIKYRASYTWNFPTKPVLERWKSKKKSKSRRRTKSLSPQMAVVSTYFIRYNDYRRGTIVLKWLPRTERGN